MEKLILVMTRDKRQSEIQSAHEMEVDSAEEEREGGWNFNRNEWRDFVLSSCFNIAQAWRKYENSQKIRPVWVREYVQSIV